MSALFSIITTNYNNAKYLSETIDSVINQTFKNWEMIIVDDNSSDNSLDIINKYIALYPDKIFLFKNHKQKGVAYSLQKGINNINSDIFGILDGDDILSNNAIEIMYNAHMNNSTIGLIYSQFMYCDQEMNPTGVGFCKEMPKNKTSLEKDCISHFKTFKLQYFKQTSGIDLTLFNAIDKDIVLKMEEITPTLFINDILYYFRVKEVSLSHGKNKRRAENNYMKAKNNAIERRKKVSIIFPYKYIDSHRDKILKWNINRYKEMFNDFEIIIGEDTTNQNEFCKSNAINNGVKQAQGYIIIIHDIDVVIDKEYIKKGIDLAYNYSYVIPYNKINKIDRQSTINMLKNNDFDNYKIIREHVHPDPSIAGGVQIFRKNNFNYISGYDESFVGWGAEDYAFCVNLTNKIEKGIFIENIAIHLWHPEQFSRNLYLNNNQHPNRLLYKQYLSNKDADDLLNKSEEHLINTKGKKISLCYEESHYKDHLLGIWEQLPEQYKNDVFTNIKSTLDNNDILLVAGNTERYSNELILVNHGAGQSYHTNSASYAGGEYRGNVKLFIQPNEYAANLDKQRYPKATQAVVGCTKLDKWHQRKLAGEIKKRGKKPVIAISFHFDCRVCPETRSAWEYYKSILPMLAYKNINKEWEILGHGHPRIINDLIPEYKKNNIEIVENFEDIMERADLYIMDHMSTLYEFASTDRPVVVLNTPWYRRNVEHGLRYWEHADVGINCNHPEELENCIYTALEDSLKQKMLREKACNAVYAFRDGMCTDRAVKAIINYITTYNLKNTETSDHNSIETARKRPTLIEKGIRSQDTWFRRR